MLYIGLFYVLRFDPTNKRDGALGGARLHPLVAGAAVPIHQGGRVSTRGRLSGLIILMPPNEVRPDGTKPDPKLLLSSCAEKHPSGFHRQL